MVLVNANYDKDNKTFGIRMSKKRPFMSERPLPFLYDSRKNGWPMSFYGRF